MSNKKDLCQGKKCKSKKKYGNYCEECLDKYYIYYLADKTNISGESGYKLEKKNEKKKIKNNIDKIIINSNKKLIKKIIKNNINNNINDIEIINNCQYYHCNCNTPLKKIVLNDYLKDYKINNYMKYHLKKFLDKNLYYCLKHIETILLLTLSEENYNENEEIKKLNSILNDKYITNCRYIYKDNNYKYCNKEVTNYPYLYLCSYHLETSQGFNIIQNREYVLREGVTGLKDLDAIICSYI